MNLQTAIEILDYHQEWRLGKTDEELTQALDMVLSAVRLKSRYQSIQAEYLAAFEAKQGVQRVFNMGYDFVIFHPEVQLQFEDIRLDIDSEQPVGSIFEWAACQGEVARYVDWCLGVKVSKNKTNLNTKEK